MFDPNFVIDHFPDNNKDRSLYKELLYYSCKEYPNDPYYGIYLGIELSRRGTKEEAIEAFKRCLRECDFTGNEDIKYQCYLNIASITDDNEEALDALYEAKEMGIYTRRMYSLFADVYGGKRNNMKILRNKEYEDLQRERNESERREFDLRKRLIEQGYRENKCAICGLEAEWNNKPLSLQVDHINGDHFDNRLENLRLVCPNCHSQTETYCGKNIKREG